MYCRLRILFCLTLFVSGCAGGSAVVLENATIPVPLIDQIPLKVGARYPEVFNHFIHEEQIIGKEKWSIDLGQSNRLLFTQLFSSMFSDFIVIDADSELNTLALDAIIEPSIDAFEFSVPSQSQTDEFAVWIRYRIKILDTAGSTVANWPIAAYGKSRTATFGNDVALQRAAELAMRDAAALIILQMNKATAIRNLNSQRTPGDTQSSTLLPEE